MERKNMFINKERGATAIDIVVSIVIITIFIAVIGNLIININLNATSTQRKTIATSYAVREIEKIKALGIDNYIGRGVNSAYIVEEDIKENNTFSGYHKKVTIKDYVLIKNDNTKEQDLIKEVIVEISYKLGNKEKNITISTYISKE